MKTAVCLLVLLAAGSALAQEVSPEPVLDATLASPEPALDALLASPEPAVDAALVSPEPEMEMEASPEPAAEMEMEASPEPATEMEMEPSPEPEVVAPEEPAAAAPAGTNITDSAIQAYYSSPLFALQQIPELSSLAGLAANTSAGKLLSDKALVSTIFAPNNDAVDAALAFVSNATSADAETLAALGVPDQLLAYHVAGGAGIIASRFKNDQVLTMLDGNKTTITIEGGARRMLLQDGPAYYINSDSNQQIRVTKANIQGGKSIIHIIDGVLVPQALLDQFNISSEGLPGAAPGALTGSRDVTIAPVEPLNATEAPAKSSAGAVAASALLALPALAAALLF